jgi:hypothetical protein
MGPSFVGWDGWLALLFSFGFGCVKMGWIFHLVV